jgi:hypothetical protein
MALCFTVSSTVHGREFMICQQLSAPLAICSQLQLASSVVYFRATCISVWQLCEIQSLGKCRQKFCDERVPSRQTIHNFVNKLRTTGLLTDKKQKHKSWVLTEEKSDDIGARLEHTPRKITEASSSRERSVKV